MRCSPSLALACITAAPACGPDASPSFEGSYEAHQAIERCSSSDRSSGTASYIGFTVDIIREVDDSYAVEPPSIDCILPGEARGETLEFPPRDCPSPSKQTDVSGTAHWTDDNELRMELQSTQTWPPSELWPDGATWDCSHTFSLAPIE
jgi:hypothetical protein